MKRYIIKVLKISGFAIFGLLASCADTSSGGGTHQMGPPNKEHSVPNKAHPSMAN